MTLRVLSKKYCSCAGVLKRLCLWSSHSATDFTDRKCQTISFALTPDGLQNLVISIYINLRYAFRAQERK
jgi:hypothetical protein